MAWHIPYTFACRKITIQGALFGGVMLEIFEKENVHIDNLTRTSVKERGTLKGSKNTMNENWLCACSQERHSLTPEKK